MFSIGEHIIHPGQGVCTVMGYENAPSPMIILEAKTGNSKTRMMYPVAQEGRLHSCISREVAERLLDDYDAIEVDPFTERNSSLEETYFKKQLKYGAPQTIRVAKTMRQRIHDAEARDKKPSSYYTRVLKEAHRRALEELAVALECTEDDVEKRLEQIDLSFN